MRCKYIDNRINGGKEGLYEILVYFKKRTHRLGTNDQCIEFHNWNNFKKLPENDNYILYIISSMNSRFVLHIDLV